MDHASRRTLIEPKKSIYFSPCREIDGFIIDSLMAEGSQATLFRVHDRASVRYVMRVYFDGCSPQRELTDTLFNTSNEKLCPVKKCGIHAGHEYDIVPELKNLSDIRNLPEREQKQLLKAEADSVKAFHATGFCNLDIKKEHFMRDASGQVKLIDIASARKIGSPVPENLSQFLPGNAYTGTVRPENDLYSFGIAILEQFLPDLFAGKTRAQITQMVLSSAALQAAADLIPAVFRDDVKLLLSDAPDMRSQCVWFRPPSEQVNAAPERRRERRYNLSLLTEDVKYELLAVAVYCSPEVFNTTVKKAARHIDFKNAESLSSFLTFLRSIPKASAQVNYTTLSSVNVLRALKSEVVTNSGRLSKNDPIKTLEELQRNGVLYIFDRQLINRLDEQSAEISAQREKRAFAALKIIGIILGVIAAIGIAIAIIAAVIYLLIYVIIIVAILAFVCALLDG